MPGHVYFEYDPEKNIVFSEDHWEVKTKQDVDEFFAEYVKYFQKLGKSVYVVSDINNLYVHAVVAEYYGKTARENVEKYVLSYARWGTNDWARLTVRTTSMMASMSPNIYDRREAAVKAIGQLHKVATLGQEIV